MYKYIFFILFIIPSITYANKKITCATSVFEPYAIKNNKGIDIDIIKKIAKNINWDVKFHYYPWARLISRAKTGRIECLFSAAFNIERSKYLEYTKTPLHITTYYVFSQKQKKINSTIHLKNKIIGIHRGYAFPEPLASMVVKKELIAIEARTEKELFKMLNLNRIDAILTDKNVGEFYSSKMKNINHFALEHPGLSTYLTFKKGLLTTDELDKINKEIHKIMNNKKLLNKIHSKYINEIHNN